MEGGGGSGTQKCVYQKWPDQLFPIVNCVFPHDGHFGLGGGGGIQGGGAGGSSYACSHVSLAPGGRPRCARQSTRRAPGTRRGTASTARCARGGLTAEERRGGGGAWRGVWDPKVCVPKMARSALPDCKLRVFPRWSLWSGGGGGAQGGDPPPCGKKT